MEAETVAFGYPARALALVQRVRNGTFGYPRQAPSLTASDGLDLLSHAWDFRSDFVRMAEILWKQGTIEGVGIKEYSPCTCLAMKTLRCPTCAKEYPIIDIATVTDDPSP
jgi:hypothetical protein